MDLKRWIKITLVRCNEECIYNIDSVYTSNEIKLEVSFQDLYCHSFKNIEHVEIKKEKISDFLLKYETDEMSLFDQESAKFFNSNIEKIIQLHNKFKHKDV